MVLLDSYEIQMISFHNITLQPLSFILSNASKIILPDDFLGIISNLDSETSTLYSNGIKSTGIRIPNILITLDSSLMMRFTIFRFKV